MEVTVKSSINVDGYEINGHFYIGDKLRIAIDNGEVSIKDVSEVTFKRGWNLFAGKPIDDELFSLMVQHFWEYTVNKVKKDRDAWLEKVREERAKNFVGR